MREEAVYAYRFEGKRYDCGSKLGYLQATVEYALGHPALGREFRRYLRALDVAAAARRAARNGRQRARAAGAATRHHGSVARGAARPARAPARARRSARARGAALSQPRHRCSHQRA